jgi:hypothetical protein
MSDSDLNYETSESESSDTLSFESDELPFSDLIYEFVERE